MKERLDVLLVKRGLAPSREKAKTMIMEGNVFVNNNREDKAGSTFAEKRYRGVGDLHSSSSCHYYHIPLFFDDRAGAI